MATDMAASEKKTAKGNTVSTKRRSTVAIGSAVVLIIVLSGVGWYFLSLSPSPSSNASSSTSNLTSMLLSGAPSLGSRNAVVTIIEFGDFQCPTCGGWYRSQEPQLIKNLVTSGKAKLVWRDFDFFGPDSVSASEAAYAAGEQGKFWQFHDLLFQSQQSPNNGWANKQKLEAFARQLGLNMTQFDQSFNSGRYDSLINSNHSLGVQAGVSETPTFFIIGPNGKMVTIAGPQPESVFEQAVASLTSG